MTLLPSRGSVCAPPLNLDGLVIASMRRRRWKWGWDIKGGICLFTQTLTLRTLSHCVRRPTTLSPPHYEKAKPHREATCRCSGQQCQPSSHPRPGSRCQGHRNTHCCLWGHSLIPCLSPEPGCQQGFRVCSLDFICSGHMPGALPGVRPYMMASS